MADAADQVTSDAERAMARFEEEQRLKRIAESHRVRDPSAARNCTEPNCDLPIEPGRLKALPFTGRCARCAIAAEKRYAQGGVG